MDFGIMRKTREKGLPPRKWLKKNGRHTFITQGEFKKGRALLDPGLLGPVTLESVTEVEIAQ
jgi:hypothetical protein